MRNALSRLNEIVQGVAQVSEAALGDSESVTLRHAGLVVKVPFAGNEDKTIAQLFTENAGPLAIPAGAKPNVSAAGTGSIDSSEKPVAGSQYDAFTDKKENA